MIWIFLSIIALTIFGLLTWQWIDRRTDSQVWSELIARSEEGCAVFDVAQVEGLPEPAQRYFQYMIQLGTPLMHAVEIDMQGELGLGTASRPNYRPMRARQILVPPHGLVWDLKSGMIRGSDGITPATSWTRFWLFNLIPIVRVGGGADHHRSAFGRVVSEAAFWVPASLLPSNHVSWESVNQTTARATVTFAGFEQAVDITVAENGQPTQVMILRWSNENPEREFREQPFGGELSGFKKFGGYTLPTRVVGGNHFGTQEYFPFYKADVTDIRFPGSQSRN